MKLLSYYLKHFVALGEAGMYNLHYATNTMSGRGDNGPTGFRWMD